MKNDKQRRTMIAMICLYLAIGIVAVILFNTYGSKMSRKSELVQYTFEDDGQAAEHVEVESIAVIGESGAKEEEPEEEVVVEEVVVEEEPQGKVFYKFVVTTKVNRLRIRREPNENAKIMNYFNKGETGYVLIKGNEWSYVTDGKKFGYCSNKYMDLTEVSLDELPEFYPEEYKTELENSEEIDY